MGKFLEDDSAQVSLEFILLTGGIIAAALTLFTLRGSIANLGQVISDWVSIERDAVIAKVTR